MSLLPTLSVALLLAADPPSTPESPAPPAPSLVPSARTLRDSLAATRDRVEQAEVQGAAVVRIHNLLAERLATGAEISCDDDGLLPYLARSPLFLAAWRDATQSARVELARLESLRGEPSLQALLDMGFRQTVDALAQRVSVQVPACQEALTWEARYVTPVLQRCTPALEPGPGLPSSQPWVADAAGGPVAVVALPGGLLCPQAIPARGAAVVVPGGEACYGREDCACFAEPVLPGAVLGIVAPALPEGEDQGTAPAEEVPEVPQGEATAVP